MTRREARHRARTDLFWFAKNVLGYDLSESVHGVVCRRFFIAKDRRVPFAAQHPKHNRLLLDPRGHFKTTLDIADAIQWVLNFPDVRILFMSGTQELATRMVLEAASHFQQNPRMRTLFPEFCGDDLGNSEEFTIPCRSRVRREPTISMTTTGSVKAGSHFDIIKYDDVVHEHNVGTPKQLQQTSEEYDYTFPLLDPGGYRDVIGTRYSPDDLYGRILQQPLGWVFLVRRACKIDADGRPADPVLFAERFTVELLREYQALNPWQFSCQYLNEPRVESLYPITQDALTAHTVPAAKVPRGTAYAAWDLAFSQNSASDYSACVVVRADRRGRLFVVDAVRGRWSPFDLVLRFYDMYLKWRPARIAIEKAAGSELLSPGLAAYGAEHGLTPTIDWVKPQGPKSSRILALDPLLREERLWFAAEISEYNQLCAELTSVSPKSLPRHDDLADALALAARYRAAVDADIPALAVPLGGVAPHPLFDGDTNVLGAGLIG